MGRPREHNEETRRRLLEAAEAVVGARGAGALSVRRLADEVGTTTRAVYSSFGSKAGLVGALYRLGFDRLADEFRSVAVDEDPWAELQELGLAYRRAALSQPNLYELMFGGPVAEFVPSAQDYLAARATFDRLREAVQRASEHSPMVIGIESATMQLWAVVHGLATLEIASVPTEVSFDTLWSEALAVMVRGLRT